MKIYTKQGDAGQTGLFGGPRVSKDNARIHAYGTLDELNSQLGLIIAENPKSLTSPWLTRIQAELFQLGAELATPAGKDSGAAKMGSAEIEQLEHEIDAMEEKLQPLKTFILPGGSRAASQLHLARTISRRAERETVSLHVLEPLRADILKYINRLSDHLFVAARFANFEAGVSDTPWIPPKNKGK